MPTFVRMRARHHPPRKQAWEAASSRSAVQSACQPLLVTSLAHGRGACRPRAGRGACRPRAGRGVCRPRAGRGACRPRAGHMGRAQRHRGVTLSAPASRMQSYARASWDALVVGREECARQHRGRPMQLQAPSQQATEGYLRRACRRTRDGSRGSGVAWRRTCAFRRHAPKNWGRGLPAMNQPAFLK